MQNYHGDPYESEPLDSHNRYDSSPRRPIPPPHSYSPSAAHYDAPPRSNHPSAHPDSSYSRVQGGYDDYSSHGRPVSPSPYAGSAGYDSPRRPSPQQNDHGYYGNQGYNNYGGGGGGGHMGYDHPNSHTTPGADNFGMSASGGMAGIAVNVADRNPRYSGIGAMEHSNLPPPPSRTQQNPYGGNGGYGHGYDSPRGPPSAATSHFNGSDPYIDNPYPGYTNSRHGSDNLGVVNPNEIVDDGDDGLVYGKSQRNSMLSLSNSDRAKRGASATAAAVGGGAAAGGLLGGRGGSYEMNGAREKPYGYGSDDKDTGRSKRCKWLIIVVVFLVIVGAIVGGVVGSMVNNGKKDDSTASSGESAKDDTKKNGDLGKNSAEIKDLLNNPDLHRVFPGMDYTPLNSQYPDCMHNPPSQNNITRDVAVLGQLTNKIRLYGTDCNQTQMLIHALDRLELKDTKIWMGVWLDKNETTNDRQMAQMWDILDEYGDAPFEGIIIANEILFREEMNITTLAKILDDTRTKLDKKGLKLPVATSDLGDDWTSELATDSDYIMANIHPFFAGVEASEAAAWTSNFWKTNNGDFWKTDTKKNIISETGWPTGGGTNCGSAATCTKGSVAGIDELNTFMDDWVCQSLKNGTNYFWFEAFDEPWKERYNTKGKNWEDKWGLLTADRELKKGVKIPDCDGKTIQDYSMFSS
ncbi:putative glucan endo-1,3-beta-glucosidase btgC [Fusarium oxysporum f. sp. cubense]|uniref:glucan endo-1,3-beta-D-glucosidase n=1 Tax=Fusarium oxysporum f. sp. cubense TaxID=61366 RepID=A0A559KNH3_FUSOC|nr:putative glucan endo-1,3-beta-glucosidase btgC [Fusarium oxysporum f. sp. cubense]